MIYLLADGSEISNFDLDTPYVDAAGTQYHNRRHPEIQVMLGITTAPDPVPPPGFAEGTYTVENTLDRKMPYRIWTRKTQSVIDAAHNDGIIAQIKALESSELMPRILRDLVSKQLAADAAAAGTTLPALYATATIPNPDYDPLVVGSLELLPNPSATGEALKWKKYKDFDDAITALIAELM